MFESAEIGACLTKAKYKKEAPKLRLKLLETQHALAKSRYSLLLVVGGVEGSGKTEFANHLLGWLDARGLETHAFGEPSDEERERPDFWRFWRIIPASGKATFLLSSWYSQPIVERTFKEIKSAAFDQRLQRIRGFEEMLVSEKVILIKLWFHLSKAEQKRRFKAFEKDPDTRWRVTPRDWKFHKKYDEFRDVSEHALRATSTGLAPWHIVEASDRRYRDMAASRLVLEALQQRLKSSPPAPADKPKLEAPKPKAKNVLRALNMSLALEEAEYDKRLEKLQGRLGELTRKLKSEGRSLIIVMEGPDAAGKGGAIRRMTGAMDARLYRVQSVAAPSDEEKARPYLWRFWRALPRLGRVTIYDRSWYGRVLVERVEGFAAPHEWGRAYAEINTFEEELADAGTILIKFWLAISPEEQLKRFKDRQETPFKQYKITPEDWRNREKWDAYEAAACEMFERTSSSRAPWVLVEGNDKNWARVKILDAVVGALKNEIG